MSTVGRPRLHDSNAAKCRAYRQRQAQKAVYPDLPAGPYRVLYADPPWQYFSTDPYYQGHARDHYRTLSITQLCALPVKRLLTPKAVLFLWITSPILAECFPVIKAWGFTYKTNLVWHKDTHNYGYYLSNEHELLLICTRGACKPDVENRFPSVQRIVRTSHSTKPLEIRMLIDTLYPEGRRLELFARTHTPGWDVWGDAVP
jgi:N6-adenosine-specific RNA methylase IME4